MVYTVAADRAGGKFYRRTGRRLPVFGAEAAAVICARVRRRNNNSLSSLGRSPHCHRRRRRRRRRTASIGCARPPAILYSAITRKMYFVRERDHGPSLLLLLLHTS
jgi:hypothetical protein